MSSIPPHVLIFPFPALGHVNSMLNLAELLSNSGLNITFLNSQYNHERLVQYTNIEARYPLIQFKSIWDGLPSDHSRSGDRFTEMFESMKMVVKSSFKDMLITVNPPVNCIIADGIMGSFIDVVANEVDIPLILFRTIGASCFWVYFSLPQVIEATEIPTTGHASTKLLGVGLLNCKLRSTFQDQEAKEMEQASNPPHPHPHVLIFPFPIQGHVNSMLKLAEVLSIEFVGVTFVNTENSQKCLTRFTDNIEARFLKYPGFQFRIIPDCLPDDHSKDAMDYFESLRLISQPLLKEMLIDLKPPVNCIIGDGVLGFIRDTAIQLGIPIIDFRTISACSFWSYFCLPNMLEANELPIKGEEDMDRLITKVPGMENFIRCRDLPSFCRASNMEDPILQMVIKETRQSSRAQAHILNTFEDLEAPILSQIRNHFPKIYTIGPLHELLNTKLRSINTQEPYQSSNSLWEVDRTCIAWLDTQPSHSVIYISFGSITVMTKEELMEFWHGIINSKKRFLWVIRPGSIKNKDGDIETIPQELQEGLKESGYIVKWAPQEDVLAHKAVGGFFTHSGWNSTLESIVAGVPMICWPYFADQQLNSRFVGEVWKLGLDMKDVSDRVTVEKMVNDLMVDRREEFLKSSARMAHLARKSVNEGGSSSCNLNRLIQDIKLMSAQALSHEDV